MQVSKMETGNIWSQRGQTGGAQLGTFTKTQLGKKKEKKSNIPPVPDMLVFSKSLLYVENRLILKRRFTQITKGYIQIGDTCNFLVAL